MSMQPARVQPGWVVPLVAALLGVTTTSAPAQGLLGPPGPRWQRAPGVPGMFAQVWVCGRCNKEVGHGWGDVERPTSCPFCGVRFVNGVAVLGLGVPGPGFPGGFVAPPAPQHVNPLPFTPRPPAWDPRWDAPEQFPPDLTFLEEAPPEIPPREVATLPRVRLEPESSDPAAAQPSTATPAPAATGKKPAGPIWNCERCKREVGRGEKPNLLRCPHCGTQLGGGHSGIAVILVLGGGAGVLCVVIGVVLMLMMRR